jgi:hypothetical protein
MQKTKITISTSGLFLMITFATIVGSTFAYSAETEGKPAIAKSIVVPIDQTIPESYATASFGLG